MEKPYTVYPLKNGKKLEIYNDPDPQDPRENDNLGIMVCGHRRYTLGDEQIKEADATSWDDLRNKLEHEGAIGITPLRLYDHSGLSMSTGSSYPYNCAWDSMMVGFIYTDKKHLEMTGVEYDPTKPETLANIKAQLEAEVKEYNMYLNGDVYGFVLRGPKETCDKCHHTNDGEEIESCWGFFGSNIEENGILDRVPLEIRKEILEKRN